MLRIGNTLDKFRVILLKYRVPSMLFLKHKPDQIFQAHGKTNSGNIFFHDNLDRIFLGAISTLVDRSS
jgi:hypothetical protein